MTETPCCGCGDVFDDLAGPTHPYILSSPGCWRVYGELLAREYQDPRYMRVHRLTVDAYAVQHPGVDTLQARNSVGIHLSRLLLLFERGWPIERANAAMLTITLKKNDYPWLTPPSTLGSLTVRHPLAAAIPEEHAERVEQWAHAVWTAWAEHHPTVRRWCAAIEAH
ncbi:MAG TPA: DUF5946 family protein [Acidobacteriaceae bacterium]|jgi:hypothetical protein|nr:DUF5946 family protein [Acidobacteriaceae bacterium]